MRGIAPTLHCPRCDLTAPPGAGTGPLGLVTCARCGLAYDVGPGMRAVTAPPRPPPPPELPGHIERVGATLRIRIASDDGGAVLVSIVAVAFTAMALHALTWAPLVAAALFALALPVWLWGVAPAVGHHVVTVDADGITLGQRPVPWRRLRIARDDVRAISVASSPGIDRHHLVVTTETRSHYLLHTRDADLATEAAALMREHLTALGARARVCYRWRDARVA